MIGRTENGTTPTPGTETEPSWHETPWWGDQYEYLTVTAYEFNSLDYYGAKGWRLVAAYCIPYIPLSSGSGARQTEHVFHFIRDMPRKTPQRRKPGVYHDGVAGNVRVHDDGHEEALGDF